jgi:putative oxidoreductase
MATDERPLLATHDRVPTFDVAGWVLRISAGLLFLWVGLSKFESHSSWVQLFDDIGLGNWFRYLTGAIQVAGGLLFLARRTVYAAAVLAGSTMIGAVVVHMFVLDTGFGGAIFPLALLVFISVVATRRPE